MNGICCFAQIGPGIVHLHFDCALGKGVLVQSLTPVEPLHQVLTHNLYATWKFPTCIGRIFLMMEAIQVGDEKNNSVYYSLAVECKNFLRYHVTHRRGCCDYNTWTHPLTRTLHSAYRKLFFFQLSELFISFSNGVFPLRNKDSFKDSCERLNAITSSRSWTCANQLNFTAERSLQEHNLHAYFGCGNAFPHFLMFLFVATWKWVNTDLKMSLKLCCKWLDFWVRFHTSFFSTTPLPIYLLV